MSVRKSDSLRWRPWSCERGDGGVVAKRILCSSQAVSGARSSLSHTRRQNVCALLSPVWLVLTNRVVDNVLDNEQLQVDFKPLYECIHIYSALDSLDEIRRSYQADRKVRPLPLYMTSGSCYV